MQDPSSGVSPQLLPYVHLISSFRYPIHQNLSDEDAVNYLLNAPRIVREMAPMAWQFIYKPPDDGTVILAWQPPSLRGRFASDGYIWADPEQTYHFEHRGFSVEVLIHRSGYRPQIDPIACHARKRYHIIHKQPSMQNMEVDSSLWIVHYGPSEPQARYPIQNIRMTPEIQKVMQDRAYLLQQGQLVRKEFMLQDRSSWPTINFPGQVAGQYAQPQMQQRPGQPGYYPQPASTTPLNKRLKTTHPPQPGPPGMSAVMDFLDDEDTALGDYLDHLTPREISTVRYKQHHEWMEEIFSSVYANSQIIPEDLGLGLAGDLNELTAGILDNTLTSPSQQGTGAKSDGTPTKYQRLEPGQMDELEKRISEFVEKGQAELRAMKSEHAKKLGDSRRSKTYMLAERRLREASGSAAIDAVVSEVETSLGVTITPRKEVFCVLKGGLEEEDKTSAVVNGDSNGTANDTFNGMGLNGNGDEASAGDNTAANLLDQFGSGSYGNTPDARIPTPQMPNLQSQPPSAGPTPGPAAAGAQQPSGYLQEGPLDEAPPDDSGLDLIEGMDLDVDIGGGDDLTTAGNEKAGAEDDWVMVGDDQNQNSVDSAQPAGDEGSVNVKASIADTTTAEDENGAAGAEAEHDVTTADLPEPEENEHSTEMFGTADDFGSFDNLDTAGDALADYTGGDGAADDDDLGLNLDDSAFGEAFAGTEAQTEQLEEGAQ